jgi:hypothetical protein
LGLWDQPVTRRAGAGLDVSFMTRTNWRAQLDALSK